ncbi:MAG: YicC family protein [Acidobacteria bacterium]|nr:YicC family protein [Acidobacteriota bacterium]
MIRSMTGYSEGHSEGEGFRLSLTLRSTNHRYLDLHFRVPRALANLESRIRDLLKRDYRRGHLEANLSWERVRELEPRMDRELLETYLKACLEVREAFNLSQEPDVAALARIPGVISSGNGELEPAEWERLEGAVDGLTSKVLKELNGMRLVEGQALEKDIRSHLDRIRSLVDQVEKLGGEAPSRAQQKIEVRVRKLLGEIEVDAERLAQEVALLASQADISEEMARLRSHLDQAGRLLAADGVVGKKLDFLLQEMNREANTVLSKTGGAAEDSLEITRLGVELKSEIEKIREQVQNIE